MMTGLLSFSIMIPNPIQNPEILQLTTANALILSFRDVFINSIVSYKIWSKQKSQTILEDILDQKL